MPIAQGVTVSLTSPSITAGTPATLTVSADVGATSGVYTATLTGTLGANTHSVSVPFAVDPPTGIPQLYEAVPINGTAVIDTPATANTGLRRRAVHRAASSPYTVTFRTAPTCPNGSLGAGATSLGSQPITTDANGESAFAGPVSITDRPAVDLRLRPGHGPDRPGLVGPCIVASPPNDQWPYAFDISSRTAGAARRPAASSMPPAGPAGTSSTSSRAARST